MVFNSVQFILFFPIVLLIYFIFPKKWRYLWLLVASYFFYMCWNVKYIVLLLFSTVVTYAGGYILEIIKQSDTEENKKQTRKKITLVVCILLNLSVLFFFKYFHFFMDSLNSVLSLVGVEIGDTVNDYLLPVGISFYTFQALGYVIDVYRGDIYAEKNFFRYALFVSFFPQLVAGPIERSKNLLKQLAVPHEFDTDRFRDGFLLMLWGYFMKVVVADRLAIFVDCVYGDPSTYGGLFLVIATLLFAIQIYCDFAGYSIIAMGAAKILGINLVDNFDAPYLSTSVSDFWRRWHISLNSWFRDYLYIPLGGNRKGKFRKYVNLMIVFLVSGLWHGASWTYVIWGGLNGIYQVISGLTSGLRKRLNKLLHMKPDSFSHKLMQVLMTFTMIDFSWIFFRASSFDEAKQVIKSILTVHNPSILFNGSLYECGLVRVEFLLIALCIALIFFVDYMKCKGVKLREVICRQEWWFRWTFMAAAVLFILLVGIWGTEYTAANFIYFQF